MLGTLFMRRVAGALALAGGIAAAGSAFAASATVTVYGSSNPFLAGQPDGTGCCGGDSAPGQSAVYVSATLTPGSTITFSGTGGFNYGGGTPSSSLDGDNDGTSLTYIFDMTADYGTGLSGPRQVNVDGLVGVFLTNAVPSGPAPAQLDYGALGLDAASYAPGLDQIFWIGDGLTGLGAGSVQSFLVPVGATRLFLGTVDGTGWSNNSGVGNVTVNGVTPLATGVPEPATWMMMIGGLGALGIVAHRRKRALRATALSVRTA